MSVRQIQAAEHTSMIDCAEREIGDGEQNDGGRIGATSESESDCCDSKLRRFHTSLRFVHSQPVAGLYDQLHLCLRLHFSASRACGSAVVVLPYL